MTYVTRVYFTSNIEAPPARFKKPPTKTALKFRKSERVTRKGAPMLPKFDIASVIPSPVDLIVVGKVYEEIRLKRANPTVLNSLLMPRKMISVS